VNTKPSSVVVLLYFILPLLIFSMTQFCAVFVGGGFCRRKIIIQDEVAQHQSLITSSASKIVPVNYMIRCKF
jgi:hypothetical protein